MFIYIYSFIYLIQLLFLRAFYFVSFPFYLEKYEFVIAALTPSPPLLSSTS